MNWAWLLFLSSVAFGAWVMILYPLALGVLARFRSRPVRKRFTPKTVSVVIPVRNGAPWLAAKLESVFQQDYPALREVIVVSDGSEDGTDDIARTFAGRGTQLIRLPRGGKPAALNAACPQAKGEILVLTDVRQQLEPESIARMVACFDDPAVGVVSGELLIQRGEKRQESDIGLYWRMESWIRRKLSDLDSMLGATGPFYAIRRELFVPIPPDTLLDDVFLPLAAFFRGYRLIVEPDARAWDYPTALGSEFRRKVRTLAGNYQLLALYPRLLGPSNRMWLHFMSLKMGRLLLPFAMLVALGSSLALPFPWRLAALLPQLAVYALALADSWIPETFSLKRFTSPARTFVTMMAAAVCALSILFVPPRSLWKETRVRAADSHTLKAL